MSPIFKWFIGFMLITTGLILLAIAMTGCASTGLYSMSDSWCAEHPNASAAHCGGRQ
jgi:hypothetical protein